MRAYIVVDLGFGDSGKGLLTDFLVRHCQASLVIRYNGGAQAAHNVVTPDGRHHTFSQFGSGTFVSGVKTYLSREVVIHPSALLVEGDILFQKGIKDVFSRIRISDQCLVITPFHQAANRIREIVRGSNRHGSCGIGVGEAVEDAALHPEDRIFASDLYNPQNLQKKLRSTLDRKRLQILAFCKDYDLKSPPKDEWRIFEEESVIDRWISSISRIRDLDLVAEDSAIKQWTRETETTIFEGAQGVLLDGDAGFHPYTTWSRCDTSNASSLVSELMADASVYRIGILRSYAVRHGPGPFPTETDELKLFIKEHNQYSEWQGAVRYGWFDAVLARYALEAIGGVDALAITHLDTLTNLDRWKYCFGYAGYYDTHGKSVDINILKNTSKNLEQQRSLSLEKRTQLTQTLSKVQPLLETCDTSRSSVIAKIESLVDRSVDVVSDGPGAGDVKILNTISN